MMTRVFTISCEHTKKGTAYFINKHMALYSGGSSASGGLGKIRVSKKTAQWLLGWENVDRFGSAKMIASVVVSSP